MDTIEETSCGMDKNLETEGSSPVPRRADRSVVHTKSWGPRTLTKEASVIEEA